MLSIVDGRSWCLHISRLNLNCLDFSNLPETPVSILKTLSDVRVEEDFPATLECEFSRQIIEVKWFKVMKHHKSSTLASALWGQIKLMKNTCPLSQNGKELKAGKNCRIYSMGRKRFCQIMQCSRADSGAYKCDTGELNTSCMLDVYGKSTPAASSRTTLNYIYRSHLGGCRQSSDASSPPTGCFFLTYLTEHKLEIIQDLEDLYIQEDQNAVFMCEVSLEEVAGEWYKDGQKIRPSSTIKIRTEGQRISQIHHISITTLP